MPTPIALLLLVCALGMWTVDYVRMPETWSMLLLSQSLSLTNAILLCCILLRAKASSHFSLIPAILYIVTVAVFPTLRLHWLPQLIVLLLQVFLLLTREMSDSNEPNGIVFFVSMLFCISSLFCPDALWFIVYLWVVVLIQGSFSLRTVLASLFAVALCGIYYFIAIYMGWLEPHDWSELVRREWFGNLRSPMLTGTIGILILMFFYLTGAAFRRSSYDLVSTRILLYHVVMLGLLSLPLILLSTTRSDSLAALPLFVASTESIYLLQKESESRGITLLIYLTVAIGLYITLLLHL